jgi:hypothetical protein
MGGWIKPFEKYATLFPFYSPMMLGVESGNVIGLRISKLTCGGDGSDFLLL